MHRDAAEVHKRPKPMQHALIDKNIVIRWGESPFRATFIAANVKPASCQWKSMGTYRLREKRSEFTSGKSNANTPVPYFLTPGRVSFIVMSEMAVAYLSCVML